MEMEDIMNTIEIKNLHFSYNAGEEILKGLNLTIDERSTAISDRTVPERQHL